MRDDSWIKDIKVVGFDMDGTLYESPSELSEFFRDKLRRDVFERLSERLGLSLVEVEKLYYDKKKLLGSSTATMESFGLDGKKFFEELFDEFQMDRYIGRDDRLIDMLSALRDSGYRLFLLSNGISSQVKKKLKLLGVDDGMFEGFVCCYDYGWVKPQREPFDYVVDELGVSFSECLYVGDRCETDVVGASNVGMRTVLIDRSMDSGIDGDASRGCSPDVVVKSVYEVRDVLGV